MIQNVSSKYASAFNIVLLALVSGSVDAMESVPVTAIRPDLDQRCAGSVYKIDEPLTDEHFLGILATLGAIDATGERVELPSQMCPGKTVCAVPKDKGIISTVEQLSKITDQYQSTEAMLVECIRAMQEDPSEIFDLWEHCILGSKSAANSVMRALKDTDGNFIAFKDWNKKIEAWRKKRVEREQHMEAAKLVVNNVIAKVKKKLRDPKMEAAKLVVNNVIAKALKKKLSSPEYPFPSGLPIVFGLPEPEKNSVDLLRVISSRNSVDLLRVISSRCKRGFICWDFYSLLTNYSWSSTTRKLPQPNENDNTSPTDGRTPGATGGGSGGGGSSSPASKNAPTASAPKPWSSGWLKENQAKLLGSGFAILFALFLIYELILDQSIN
jgi:hypothetical protein